MPQASSDEGGLADKQLITLRPDASGSLDASSVGSDCCKLRTGSRASPAAESERQMGLLPPSSTVDKHGTAENGKIQLAGILCIKNRSERSPYGTHNGLNWL